MADLSALIERVEALTGTDREMLRLVLANPSCAWTTSKSGPAQSLLTDLEGVGYFEQVAAPAPFLASFRITDAGRRALQEGGGEDE